MKKALSFLKQRRLGFTLMELIIVVAIISVITGLTFAGIGSIRSKAKSTARLSNVEQIRGALQQYKNDNGFYPATSSVAIGQPLVGPNGKTYLARIPASETDSRCPNQFSYESVDNGFEYNLNFCISAKLENILASNYVANGITLTCRPTTEVDLECGDNGCGKVYGPLVAECSQPFGGCDVSGTKTCQSGSYTACSAVDPCVGKGCGDNGCGGECNGGCGAQFCSPDQTECLDVAECPVEICGDGTAFTCGTTNFVAGNTLKLNSSNASGYETETTYGAVKIGSQCWMDKNINIGTFVASNQETSNPASGILRYCSGGSKTNCDTVAPLLGGMYKWHMAMYAPYSFLTSTFTSFPGSGVTSKRQGLCPKGWHMSSDYEWGVLADYVDRANIAPSPGFGISLTGYAYADATSYSGALNTWLGYNVGTKLKYGGASNVNLVNSVYYWTPNYYGAANPAHMSARRVSPTSVTIERSYQQKTNLFAIRCLKDNFVCTPTCVSEGRVCGDDGCGGSCGTCGSGNCGSDGKCTCTPNCTDKYCGESDGCTGNCTGLHASADSCVLGVEKCGVGTACPTGIACSNGRCVASECPANICGDGTALTCGASNFVVGDTLTLNSSGYETETTYGAVKVGTQCWMDKNINIGTFVASNQETSNPTEAVTRYCSGGSKASCDSGTPLVGGMYKWHMAMYAPYTYLTNTLVDFTGTGATSKRQGLCPVGWHVPSDYEWGVLADYADRADIAPAVGTGISLTGYAYADATSYSGALNVWLGTNVGTKLKYGGASNINLVNSVYYWTPNYYGAANPAHMSVRRVAAANTTIERSYQQKTNLFYLRCLKDDYVCAPVCSGKECGDNGCEGTCGTCTSPEVCDGSGQCVCTPSCSGKECGSDGCGGSCGTCTSPETCDGSGQCQSCTPSCSGKECGSDGCGGSCGSCTSPEACDGSGQCVCTPNCTGKNCGDNGCGGSCGTCTNANTCTAGVCMCGTIPACTGTLQCTGTSCYSGGCAFVYSYDGKKYYPEHAISDFAVHSLYEYPTYGVLNKLKKVDGNYSLGIWEKVPESQYMDNVELWKIFHPQNTTVVAEQLSGKIHTIANKELPIEAVGVNKKSYLDELKTEDNKYWVTDMKDFNFSNPPMFDELTLKFSAGEVKNDKVKLVVRAKETGQLFFQWANLVTLIEGPNQKKYDALNPKFFNLIEKLFGKKALKGGQDNFLGKIISSGMPNFMCKIGIRYFCDVALFNRVNKLVEDNTFLYIHQKINGVYQPVGSMMFGSVSFYHTWVTELKAVNGEPIEIKLVGGPYAHQIDTVYIDRSVDQEVKIEKMKGEVVETNMKLGLPEINKSLSERDYNYFKLDLGDFVKFNFKDNGVEPDQSSTSTFLLYANAYSEAYSFSGENLKVTDKKDPNLVDAILDTPGLERRLYTRYFYENNTLKTELPPVNNLGQ